jgi:hypothetical protein
MIGIQLGRIEMSPKYIGGKKKNNGRFSYFENGRMHMGSNHRPMTKINRDRHLRRAQKGILVW